METGMSQKELKRVEVIALRRSGRITQGEAARRLGITERQVRRLETKQGRKEVSIPRATPPRTPNSHKHPWKNSPVGKLSPEFIATR